MKNYKIVPPKQKYMSLGEIDKLFGGRGVVAYGCKVLDGTPRGGYVIAVQNDPGGDSAEIKMYMRQFKAKFPGKEPVYYIRLEPGETDKHWAITYDNGDGRKPPKTGPAKTASPRADQSVSGQAKTGAENKTSEPGKVLPDLEVKKSEPEQWIENVPYELIAEAIRTGMSMDDLMD